MNAIWNFFIFWGVWLLVPLLVDGLATLASLLGVLYYKWGRARPSRQVSFYPFVSVIIPVFNSVATLEACLHSIAAQDYPLSRVEVFLIDNGSRDNSFQVFARLQRELPFHLTWHSILNQGKAWALNAGIHLARGQYIFNIDSDVVLSPTALRCVVEAMENERDLGAVTGAIHVLPAPERASRWQRFLSKCEFMEYLTAYHVGRAHQTLLRNLYTLSGAFSAFRREVLLQTFLYDQQTVTEDTDLTFHLYERFRSWRIGCVTRAVAHVHPAESLGALYAQRVRWQRGQIEVSARHASLLRTPIWQVVGFSPARILLIDHTLAFTRLVWTLFLPVLVAFGYPPAFVLMTMAVIYLFYLGIDVLWLAVAWLDVNEEAQQRLLADLWILPLMPLYRMLVFWFRLSGFLHAVAEPGAWRVHDPARQMREGWSDLVRQIQEMNDQPKHSLE